MITMNAAPPSMRYGSHSNPMLQHASNESGGAGNPGTPTLLEVLRDPEVAARKVEAARGRVIYDPDAPATKVHFIERGQVRLYQVDDLGNGRLCEILGPGDWFGAAAIAAVDRQGLRAVAVEASTLLEASADRLLDVLAGHPQAMVQFTRRLAGQLVASRENASEFVFYDTNDRLITALLRFSRSVASTRHEEDGAVTLNITHSQLAQAVGAARETISLALTELRHKNLVRTGRNQLWFNPEALARVQAEWRRSKPGTAIASPSAQE